MTVDFSHIPNIPSLPAVVRETPNVAPQVNAEMQELRSMHLASLNNLVSTQGMFSGAHDHDISVTGSSRALNAIRAMVTGQPVALTASKPVSRGR